jgi:DNA-binding transcriptional ArsR family regulator
MAFEGEYAEKPLAENEYLILSQLEGGPKRFDELLKLVNVSRPVLSKHLKHLQRVGLVYRDFETREYELVASPSAGLHRIRESEKLVDVIVDSEECEGVKFEVLDHFLTAMFIHMAGTMAVRLSKAVEEENPRRVHDNVSYLIRAYVEPYLHFLAMYVHGHRLLLGWWLEDIGRQLLHHAERELQSESLPEQLKSLSKNLFPPYDEASKP